MAAPDTKAPKEGGATFQKKSISALKLPVLGQMEPLFNFEDEDERKCFRPISCETNNTFLHVISYFSLACNLVFQAFKLWNTGSLGGNSKLYIL